MPEQTLSTLTHLGYFHFWKRKNLSLDSLLRQFPPRHSTCLPEHTLSNALSLLLYPRTPSPFPFQQWPRRINSHCWDCTTKMPHLTHSYQPVLLVTPASHSYAILIPEVAQILTPLRPQCQDMGSDITWDPKYLVRTVNTWRGRREGRRRGKVKGDGRFKADREETRGKLKGR